MTVIKKTDIAPPRPIVILLYGTPGVGKTSLCNTAFNPILLDCDKGFDRAVNRADTISAKNWQEIMQDESHIKNYKTIIIDTAKAVLDDFLMMYAIETDYNAKKNQLKAYGLIGQEFKNFINRRRAEGLDIIIIAHAKEEKNGDITRLLPDVTGQSKELLLRIADQVGFMTTTNNKRTIQFEPTDITVGKNVAKIQLVEIPDEKEPAFNTFMAEIIEKVRLSIHSQSEAQQAALEAITGIQQDIEQLITFSNANAILDSINANDLGKAQTGALKASLLKKTKSLNIPFDRTTKLFTECTTQE